MLHPFTMDVDANNTQHTESDMNAYTITARQHRHGYRIINGRLHWVGRWADAPRTWDLTHIQHPAQARKLAKFAELA